MKRFSVYILILCCIFISSVSFAAEKVALDAKLVIVSGLVKLTHADSNEADFVDESCQLYSGDVIETLSDAKAKLSYSDGTSMRIKEKTLVEVQPKSIRIFKGSTWHKFTKRGTEFRIETPSFVAGIKGTEFEVKVDSAKSSLSVFEGAVAVRGNNSGDVLLAEGKETYCDAKGNVSDAKDFNVTLKKSSWYISEWNSSEPESDKSTPKMKKTIKTLSKPTKR